MRFFQQQKMSKKCVDPHTFLRIRISMFFSMLIWIQLSISWRIQIQLFYFCADPDLECRKLQESQRKFHIKLTWNNKICFTDITDFTVPVFDLMKRTLVLIYKKNYNFV